MVNDNLKFYTLKPHMNTMQRKWLEFLCKYYIKIKDIKGKENKLKINLEK